MDHDIFKRNTDEYKVCMLPTNNYLKQTSNYIAKTKDIPLDKAVKVAKKIISKSKKENPTVTFRYRDDKGDRSMITNSLTGYLKEVVDNNEVLTPSFTVLDHPSKKKSLHAEFLDINIKLRKQDKHKAFMYKQQGDADKYLHYNTLQKVRKIFNNSLSGAYASKSTILYHPAAHSILTSITRSVASIGNAVSESVIAGNKHLRSPEVTMNYIVSIISHVPISTVSVVVNRFNLHQPTSQEVYDMIIGCSSNYWRDIDREKDIKDFLDTLNGYELSAVMYCNDLFNLKKYNDEFVKEMLGNISRRVETGCDPDQHLDVIKDSPEGVMNLVHHICMEDIKGMNVDYKKLVGSDLLDILASTAKNVNKYLMFYKSIFRAFFTTDILPINIAHIKEMIRESIVLSDTDSTCGSYDKWVEWYFGHDRYSSEAVALAATVMTINTQVIDHNIKIFAKNMNIEDQLVELLKMKNEFFWSAFVTANVSKHYYADTWIQEGNVFKEADLELKGVHLISSAGSQEITKEAHGMMSEINGILTDGLEPLDPYKYLKQVADAERRMIDKIEQGDINIFKTEKIKSFESYKSDIKEKSPYYHHMLWEEVFASKYGSPGNPEYMCLKIPTTLVKKRTTKEYLDSLDDQDIANGLVNVLTKYKKESLGIFRVPLAIAGGVGVPKEIIECVDVKRMVNDSLNVMYIVLESIGIYRKPGMLIKEMGY